MSGLRAALAGVRVVAIEQAVAAPLCSRHLADLGADVVKVERVEGDFARRYDSMVDGMATHFVWLNGGKRSLAVDLKAPAGRLAVARLLERADVLVSNLGPGALNRLFADGELDANERLVRCAITGYGSDGPFAARKSYDLLVQGEAGVTASTGTPTHLAKCGISVADLAGGLYAFSAVLAALVERERTGRGTSVEVSLFDALAEWMMPLLLAQRHQGRTPPPAGTHHATITPYGSYTTADGSTINVAIQNDGQWRALCRDVLARPDLVDDPDYVSNEARLAHRRVLEATVADELGRAEPEALRRRLDAAGVPWGELNEVPAVVDHPQLVARRRWTPASLPGGGTAEVLVAPFLPAQDAGSTAAAPAVPALGAHSTEVLAEIGYGEGEIGRLVSEGIVVDGSTGGTRR